MIDEAVQMSLLFASAAVILAQFCTSLNPILGYGKTKSQVQDWWLIYVPKAWFSHFYILSFLLGTANMGLVLTKREYKSSCLVILPFLAHSFRRDWEVSYAYKTSSESKMHVTHYIAGLWFYLCVNLASLSVVLSSSSSYFIDSSKKEVYSFFFLLLFFYFQYRQHCHHRFLNLTEKYRLPSQFGNVACPHYGDEILIYLMLNCLVVTNFGINYSFLVIQLWVCVNLGISGLQSYKYYKANGETVNWVLFPFLY